MTHTVTPLPVAPSSDLVQAVATEADSTFFSISSQVQSFRGVYGACHGAGWVMRSSPLREAAAACLRGVNTAVY